MLVKLICHFQCSAIRFQWSEPVTTLDGQSQQCIHFFLLIFVGEVELEVFSDVKLILKQQKERS